MRGSTVILNIFSKNVILNTVLLNFICMGTIIVGIKVIYVCCNVDVNKDCMFRKKCRKFLSLR